MGGVLLPHRGVGEHLDEHAADHRPRLEALLLAGHGVVPVGQRDAAGRFVGELPGRSDELVEIGAVVGERGGPEDPVELGVVACDCRAAGRTRSASSGRRRSPCARSRAGRDSGRGVGPRPGCTSGSRCRACRRRGGSGRRRRRASIHLRANSCAVLRYSAASALWPVISAEHARKRRARGSP